MRVELDKLLQTGGFDAKRLPKGTTDGAFTMTSRREKRVLVTNDGDFSSLSLEEVFAVVWLRIPQRDLGALTASFRKLLAECTDWKAKLIVLRSGVWRTFPLEAGRRRGTRHK